MQIFSFAKQLEIDGEKYYRELAQSAPDKGLTAILNLLADGEKAHLKVIEEMETKSPCTDGCDDPILDNAKTIFLEMKESGTTFDFDGQHYAEAYQKAVTDEIAAIQFYEEKAEATDNPYHRDILLKLAEEEKKHKHLLENLVEFVGRPEAWVENAEFSDLDQY